MADANGFQQALKSFHDEVKAKAVELHKRLVAEVFTGLVQGNPVGNPSTWKHPAPKGYVGGASRRAWRIELNGGASGDLTVIAGAQFGDRVRITNDASYMQRLNEGWSRQAPPGWIDAVVQRVLAKYPRGGA